MKWSREHSDQIQIHILPPASPKLNPTETVWRITKKTATHNRFFPAPTLLKITIRRRFNRYQGNPASLRGVVKEW
jgi:transposase